jgi:hypothetical protein
MIEIMVYLLQKERNVIKIEQTHWQYLPGLMYPCSAGGQHLDTRAIATDPDLSAHSILCQCRETKQMTDCREKAVNPLTVLPSCLLSIHERVNPALFSSTTKD